MKSSIFEKHTKQNLIGLLLLAGIWLVMILGCGDVHVPSTIHWTNGCVNTDKSLLGVSGDEAVLFDLKTGAVKKHLENLSGSAVCLPNGEMLIAGEQKAVWLTSDKQVPGKFGTFGSLDNERLLSITRSQERKDSKLHFLEPLQISITNLDSPAENQKPLSLENSLFPGVSGFEFRTIAFQLLKDKRLLVAAGEEPPSGTLAHPQTPWGFFMIDVEKRSVEPFGEVKTSDDAVNLINPDTPFTATPDGKTIVGIFGTTGTQEPKTMALFSAGKEAGRTKIENAESISRLRINENGSLLALGINEKNGCRLEVISLPGGKRLWTTKTDSPISYLEFLDDDSLILMTEQRELSRRVGKTGETMWETKGESLFPNK